MTQEIVKAEVQQIAGDVAFRENLIERFAKFASVKAKSVETYVKALRQMFKYFAANLIARPNRENLVEWLKGMNGAHVGDEKTPRLLLDKDNVLHVEGEIAEDGQVYTVVDAEFKKGSEVVGKKKSPSTIQLYAAAAKVFFKWTAEENIYKNIADHVKSGVAPGKTHKKDAPTPEECAALIKSVNCVSKKKQIHNELMELRNRAILSLMTTTGLRTIEVIRANFGDIHHKRGKAFLSVQGKGHDEKDAYVLLSKQTYKAIMTYIKSRGKVQANDPLFISTSNRNKNGRLDTQTIRKMVKSCFRAIDLDSPRYSAHSLRHATASNLIFLGVELGKVSKTLCHARLDTTMLYISAWERYQNDSEQLLSNAIFKE